MIDLTNESKHFIQKNDSLNHHKNILMKNKNRKKKKKVKFEENICMKLLYFLKDCQLN